MIISFLRFNLTITFFKFLFLKSFCNECGCIVPAPLKIDLGIKHAGVLILQARAQQGGQALSSTTECIIIIKSKIINVNGENKEF